MKRGSTALSDIYGKKGRIAEEIKETKEPKHHEQIEKEVKQYSSLPDVLSQIISGYGIKCEDVMPNPYECHKTIRPTIPIHGEINCTAYCIRYCDSWFFKLLERIPSIATLNGFGTRLLIPFTRSLVSSTSIPTSIPTFKSIPTSIPTLTSTPTPIQPKKITTSMFETFGISNIIFTINARAKSARHIESTLDVIPRANLPSEEKLESLGLVLTTSPVTTDNPNPIWKLEIIGHIGGYKMKELNTSLKRRQVANALCYYWSRPNVVMQVAIVPNDSDVSKVRRYIDSADEFKVLFPEFDNSNWLNSNWTFNDDSDEFVSYYINDQYTDLPYASIEEMNRLYDL